MSVDIFWLLTLLGTYVGYNPDDSYFYGYNPALWGDEIVKFDTLVNYLPLAEQNGF